MLVALGLTAALLWHDRRRPARALHALVALVLLAVFLNAGITGVISGPFARYQARLIWLIPALAGIVAAASLRRPTIASIPPSERDQAVPKA